MTENAFVGMVASDSKDKKPYTKKEDQTIIKLKKAKKSVKEIAAKLPGRSANGVRARILNTLRLLSSLDEYDYEKGRINVSKTVLNERRTEMRIKVKE